MARKGKFIDKKKRKKKKNLYIANGHTLTVILDHDVEIDKKSISHR